jgi:hypothetical protein
MSAEHCTDYWQACGGVLDTIIFALPQAIQTKIREDLHVLAAAQAKEGHHHASHFSLMVSGEKPPVPKQANKPRAHLRLVASK